MSAELAADPQFAGMVVAKPEVPGIEKVSGSEVDYLVLMKTRPGTQDTVTRDAPPHQGQLREEPYRAG